jgi:hypothetical protein
VKLAILRYGMFGAHPWTSRDLFAESAYAQGACPSASMWSSGLPRRPLRRVPWRALPPGARPDTDTRESALTRAIDSTREGSLALRSDVSAPRSRRLLTSPPAI